MVVFHTFHREPPPGFRGLQRHLPIRFYTRHLPHWRQDGATYFVTFRLADALPPDVLKLMKGYVARQLNQHLERKGSLWEQESYDRIIRDEVHLENVIRYIGRNGAKAGLPANKFLRWIDPDWVQAGWNFD